MFKFWELLSNECRDWSVGVVCTALAAGLVASSVAWPVVYYHTAKRQQMIENGYEEQTDSRGNQIMVKVKGDGK